MILSIPTKTKENYIKLCHEAYEVNTNEEFHINRARCEAYSTAIKDICGSDVWYAIVAEADQSFPENVAVCAGIPIYYKTQILENQ